MYTRCFGPIRTRGQVLNVITFLTKTKLSRQVRDILKKTKGVIISTIALHVLLASWYISRHGRLLQTSNNQADPFIFLPNLSYRGNIKSYSKKSRTKDLVDQGPHTELQIPHAGLSLSCISFCKSLFRFPEITLEETK